MIKYIGLALALIGAGLSYPAKKILIKMKDREPDEKEVLKLKFIGLAFVVAGALCILIDNMMK